LVDGLSLMPDSEYRHPREVTRLKGKALHPGALQSFK
jgi:hypothetical protein